MTTFVDTSAVYAYLDRADANHPAARDAFQSLLDAGERLVTHHYVVVESAALVQRRLGADAVRALFDDVLPVIELHYVEADVHRLATASLLGAASRAISLVDWTSFVLLREERIDRALAFDDDFARQGLATIPARGPTA